MRFRLLIMCSPTCALMCLFGHVPFTIISCVGGKATTLQECIRGCQQNKVTIPRTHDIVLLNTNAQGTHSTSGHRFIIHKLQREHQGA